ncbi:MAG: ribonuclease Y [Candidatus Aminicenantia bacterium]
MLNDIFLIIGILLIVVNLFVLLFVKKYTIEKINKQAQERISALLEEARMEAENIKREAGEEAKDRYNFLKNELERQNKERKNRLNELERRLIQKEENLERRASHLDAKEREMSRRERELSLKEREIAEIKKRYESVLEEARRELERLSGLTADDAKKLILQKVENESRLEIAQCLKKMEEELRAKSEEISKNIIVTAMQKVAPEYVAESTVTIVDLPSDEMKGRIIGREGRNIRAFEMATGVDLIIDDTPEAVTLSCFDPLRREIARISLERLIMDGRIHPARIEEIVEKVKEEIEEKIKEEGEKVMIEFGLTNIHPELLKLLGRLKYRTSYGQNVLQHSKEVAYLSAYMAQELGADRNVALRAGLLHDIGKAVDKESEGTHTELSVELCRRYKESEVVIAAIASHHQDVDFPSVEAVLVQVADTLSAARPGARRELIENYIKRLEKLEEIARSFKGVSRCYALQAGREIRIIVDSQRITDEEAILLSKEIAKRIKDEMEFPGQIKVTVIREMRAIEYVR